MMKRFFAFFLTWTMIACFTLPCHAEGASSSKTDNSVTGDVYARFSSGAILWEDAAVNNGTAVVTTEDGYTITVTGIPAEAVFLKGLTIPSTETYAWDWVADCIGEKYKIQGVFEFYFEDENGNRINSDGVQVTIQDYDNDCVICSVSTTGQTEELDYVYENGMIRFTADGSDYYVLAKKVSAADSADLEETTVEEKPVITDKSTVKDKSDMAETNPSPATDDGSYLMVWVILAIVSGSILMWLLYCEKYKMQVE